jgi:hypothetical protein
VPAVGDAVDRDEVPDRLLERGRDAVLLAGHDRRAVAPERNNLVPEAWAVLEVGWW